MNSRRLVDTPTIRRAKIVDFINRRGEATVDELSANFSASPETIRRDLAGLAELNKIRKVHGGAKPSQLLEEGLFTERMSRNALGKKLIAEKVSELIAPGQTLFIDTGSTTLMCAESLGRLKHLTIVTNSSRIAATLSEASGQAKIFLLGGQYRGDNAQTIGPIAIEDISRYRADIALITVGGLDENGCMDYSHDEAQIARAMIFAADQLIVVADKGKFNKRAAFSVCAMDRIDTLVVDTPLPENLTRAANNADVKIINASNGSRDAQSRAN